MKKYLGWVFLLSWPVLILLFFTDHTDHQTPPANDHETSSINTNVSGQTTNQRSASTTQNNYPSDQTQGNPKINQKIESSKQSRKYLYLNGKTYPNRIYKTMVTPNDPLYDQWWIAPNGMQNVWDIPTSSYIPKVAIIDTGFALAHQEFTGRWATNSAEEGPTSSENSSQLNCTDQSLSIDRSCNLVDDDFDGVVDNETGPTTLENPSDLNCSDQLIPLDKACNNVDDDENLYVDDVTGWDFADFDPSVQAGQLNPTGSGTTHGTQTSGILGASGNNSVGIAGVNWHIKILPIQALDDDGYGDSYTVGQSVYYAADQGADIISISLGTDGNDPYLREAILYALDKGSFVVAASGNDGCDCISYPANYPEVLAVGAINSSESPASFSSYGANLDILAPGQSMTSPTFAPANQTSAYATNIAGTSFATPFVAGLLAYGKSIQPYAAWEEIVGLMLENSNRSGLNLTTPHTSTLGFGMTKADQMLARLETPLTYNQRIQLDDSLFGSQNTYNCDDPNIPASYFYRLTKSGRYYYTANLRELSKKAQAGWSTSSVGYVCMGLDDDTINQLRILNLPAEINNLLIKQ